MNKKNMSVLLAVLLLAGAALGCATSSEMTPKDFVAEANAKIVSISVDEAKAMLDKGGIIFLDCREPKEYESGHIPGAINIPRGLIEFQISDKIPDKNAEIVVYCKSGGRSSLSTFSLVKMCYKNVKSMAGGWQAWTKAGFPVK
jgi:rhodanese-related sulfurtransferase